MRKKAAIAPPERLYTWEEVSWMTGLSIHELLELFGQDSAKGAAYESLPPRIDQKVLEDLAENEYRLQPNLLGLTG